MAAVVLSLCLSGLSYSPNVENDEVRCDVLEVEANVSSADGSKMNSLDTRRENTKTSVEEEKRGCHAFLTVWKEPKFVALVASSSVMMFGHVVPLIHLVNNFLGLFCFACLDCLTQHERNNVRKPAKRLRSSAKNSYMQA